MMGNSGAQLREAVLKSGFPEARAEAEHCRLLGRVTPEIYHVLDDGYVMEKLYPVPFNRFLPQEILRILRVRVWQRPPIRNNLTAWIEPFKERFHLTVPDFALPNNYCLCHGDPAIGNVLMQEDGSLVIADPCAPRSYLPECPEIDQGKVLQSLLGWEAVAYGVKIPAYDIPEFSERAAFWCFVSLLRILRRETMRVEPRQDILNWCLHLTNGLRHELRI
jgi:hypothetical protein